MIKVAEKNYVCQTLTFNFVKTKKEGE